MISKLIINSDDYGLTPNISKGILDGHINGVISSTTVMMCVEASNEDLERLQDYPKLGVGVHLCITAGTPLTNGKSFRDSNGQFRKLASYKGHIDVDKQELYTEWKAQIDAFIKKTHLYPDHLDSHHHIHLIKEYKEVIDRLSEEYHIPYRKDERLFMFKDTITFEEFTDALYSHNDVLEVMTHSGYNDALLESISSYNKGRDKELAFFQDLRLSSFIKEHHIKITNYRNEKW